MDILVGKSGMVTERDEAILQDLFFAPGLTTRQIARMYFDALNTAKHRMYRLRKKGLVVNLVLARGGEPSEILWRLSKRAFEREAEATGKAGERHRTWPKGRLPHLVDTNDLFVEASYALDEGLGRYPAWEWVDEPRATERYEFAGERRQHQPDAEIRFAGHRFFIERETRRAKQAPEAFEAKMSRYGTYVRYAGLAGSVAEVLFACDAERDARHALEAGRRHEMPTVAGSLEEVVAHLARRAVAVPR